MLKHLSTLKILHVLGLTVALVATCRADDAKPPASGELYSLEGSPSVGNLSSESGVTVSLADVKGAKKIKAEFTDLKGYPGLNFAPPSGNWDLSGFTGVEILVTNAGTEAITVNMKVENAGDWKVEPWSVDMITVAPGDTQPLRVPFGEAFNHPGYKLDPSHVTNVRIYITPGKTPASLLLGSPKVYKGAAPAMTEAAPDAPPPPPIIYGRPAVPKAEPEVPVFAATPALDIAGKHDFPNVAQLSDEAASQLTGLCSLADFRALPEADRHVYSFDPWPSDKENINAQSYVFNLNLGTEGVTNLKAAFLPDGTFPLRDHVLVREKDATTGRYSLGGIGGLDWNAKLSHVFEFNKPVRAFGVVVRSPFDMELRKFYWDSAFDLNGFPVSYTLTDGTVVQLGARDVRGALMKANTDAFIGVIDRTGRGIISFSYTIGGLAGNKSQPVSMIDIAFVTPPKPAVAPVISLKGSYDFTSPEAIAATPSPALDGLASLDDFRFIVADHRYVYDFGTWPQAKSEMDSNTGAFSFDLKGNGKVGEKITVTATNKAGDAKLEQITLKGGDSLPYQVLGGLGELGKGTWARQTFKFDKPVWGFGVTYRSQADLQLSRTGEGAAFPVSYTLSDGTLVNLGQPGASGGIMSAKGKTFVGVIDKTDKGISSITVNLEGASDQAQPFYIENLAFALAGPPAGDWKLTMHDEFDGNQLNPKYWTTGYTFPDVINNEMQAFVPENVVVDHGVCTIKVEHRDAVNTDRTGRTGQNQKFASGAFTSYDKFTQTYGYFEARIKMPKAPGAGLWPAFWMLPDRGSNYGDSRGSYRTKNLGMGSEIDIFEFMPRWKGLDCMFPIHMGTIWSYSKATAEDPDPHGYGSYALNNNGWGPHELYYPRADTEFHTYGLYWSPERLIFFLDSKPVFRVRDAKNIPNVPEYFLFNISISGNGWGKSPDKRDPTYAEILAGVPAQMEIDYFRAYSGTLDEAVPAAPSDIPGTHNFVLPSPVAATPPPPQPTTTAAADAPKTNEVPAAPINSTIVSPAQ